jgi:hypothetical protein
VFRRRKGAQGDDAAEAAAEPVENDVEQDGSAGDGEGGDAVADRPVVDRSSGPYDESEAPEDGLTRLDIGGMRVAAADGMELRLDVDQAQEAVTGVTAVLQDSALQLMAFAAPRTEGIWDEVRAEIRRSLAAQGPVEEVETDFGVELRATLPIEGGGAVQPVRFVGIDGPRWFLRGLFSGRAARDREAAAPLETVLRATVVVRGGDPMAPGDAIPLRIPTEVPEGLDRSEAPAQRAPLTMPERGPEITEIR